MLNLGHEIKESQLRDIWLDLGQSCDHQCRNCFQGTRKGFDNDPENLTGDQRIGVLREAVDMGLEAVLIAGAGEPFHPENAVNLLEILDFGKSKGVHTSIFTHLGYLGPLMNLPRLISYGDGVALHVKFNSFSHKEQDWFDCAGGYARARGLNIHKLLDHGFNDGRRLSLTTSIMTFNYHDIPEIFRYCRKNNVLPDIDTLLPRGRGKTTSLMPTDEELRQIFTLLSNIDREEFGNIWEPNPTYVGPQCCDRYNHNLYITKTGDVHPCLGATGVLLGNVLQTPLKDMWDSSEMQVIRQRSYDGKCLDCRLFGEHKCNSCLGRYATDLTTENLRETGKVHTTGCWNFRDL